MADKTDHLELQVSDPVPAGGLPAPKRRPFNGFLRLKDPVDLAGIQLPSFALNLLIPLGPQSRPGQVEAFIRDLYIGVYSAMQQGAMGLVSAEVADYEDLKVRQEGPRRQIRATLSTARKSRVTTLFRSYHNESHAYVAADSYLLGPLNWLSLLLRLAVVGVVLIGGSTVNPLLGLVAAVAVFVLLFTRAIRGVRMYGFDLGLRGAFPRAASDSSFDYDDCMMFLKGLMPTTVHVLRDQAKAHDIDIRAIEGPLAAIEQHFNTTTNINNGSGVMNVGGTMGNVVAGIRNVVGGKP